jgi:alpha-L-fucosidase 2
MEEKESFCLTHQGAIPSWEDGLMLGNGKLGVLAYGEDALLFSLDRIDLWDKRVPPETKEKGFSYATMVRTAKEDWKEYLRLFDASYNHPYPSKINAGTLRFSVKVSAKDTFFLDYRQASISLRIGEEQAAVRLAVKKEVIVFDVPKDWAYSFSFPPYFYKPESEGGLAYPSLKERKEGDFQVFEQRMQGGEGFFLLLKEVVFGTRKKLYLTILLRSSKSLERGKKLLRDFQREEKDEEERHHRYWASVFGLSDIKTPERNLNALYQAGRYFFASNSSSIYPLSLQGVWSRNDGSLPPWKGDYHNDINLEMSYSSYLMGNAPKEGRVLVDYLWRKRSVWLHFASSFAGVKGYLIPGVMAQNGRPLGGWPMYAYDPFCGVWLSKAFADYARYYGGERFLKERAFPFLSAIALGLEGLLVKDKAGKWTLPLSSSPEIFDCSKKSIFPSLTSFDLALLRWLYRTLKEEAALLHDERMKRHAESMLKSCPLFPLGGKGETLLAEGIPLQTSHRHFSHLLYEKELEEISFFDHPEQLQRDLRRLEELGTSEWVGFSFTEMSELASYAHEGEKAVRYLRIFQDGFVGENHFHRNMDYAHKGYSEIQSDAFTLEANIGFVDALQRAMVSFVKDTLSLFPGASAEWKEKGVSFRALRLPGGIVISASYQASLLSFHLVSAKPRSFDLYDDFALDPVLCIDGEKRCFHAKLGERISLREVKEVSYS